MIQWITRLIKAYILWQFDRHLIFWHWNRAAIIAVNNRNWATPIALSAYAPVTQTVANATFADTLSCQDINGTRYGIVFGQAI